MNNIKNKKSAGFTLIELMVVIAIIGVMTAMAGPSFSSWIPKMKLKADTREKVNYLRQARSRAIAENAQYGIYFNTDNNQIVFFKDISSPELATYEEGMDSLVHDPIDCVGNIEFRDCSFTNDVVVFYSNGSASTSGTINLQDTGSSELYTISVLASTGRVRMQ